jgi:hypothetical protein
MSGKQSAIIKSNVCIPLDHSDCEKIIITHECLSMKQL